VSPLAVTFGERKLLIFFVSDQNRTQEADGSIPFSSTELLDFFSDSVVGNTGSTLGSATVPSPLRISQAERLSGVQALPQWRQD
jgi:hypothetical protein